MSWEKLVNSGAYREEQIFALEKRAKLLESDVLSILQAQKAHPITILTAFNRLTVFAASFIGMDKAGLVRFMEKGWDLYSKDAPKPPHNGQDGECDDDDVCVDCVDDSTSCSCESEHHDDAKFEEVDFSEEDFSRIIFCMKKVTAVLREIDGDARTDVVALLAMSQLIAMSHGRPFEEVKYLLEKSSSIAKAVFMSFGEKDLR